MLTSREYPSHTQRCVFQAVGSTGRELGTNLISAPSPAAPPPPPPVSISFPGSVSVPASHRRGSLAATYFAVQNRGCQSRSCASPAAERIPPPRSGPPSPPPPSPDDVSWFPAAAAPPNPLGVVAINNARGLELELPRCVTARSRMSGDLQVAPLKGNRGSWPASTSSGSISTGRWCLHPLVQNK